MNTASAMAVGATFGSTLGLALGVELTIDRAKRQASFTEQIKYGNKGRGFEDLKRHAEHERVKGRIMSAAFFGAAALTGVLGCIWRVPQAEGAAAALAGVGIGGFIGWAAMADYQPPDLSREIDKMPEYDW